MDRQSVSYKGRYISTTVCKSLRQDIRERVASRGTALSPNIFVNLGRVSAHKYDHHGYAPDVARVGR